MDVTIIMRAAVTVGLKPTVGARYPGADNRAIPPKWPFPSTCEELRWGYA
jgi:hypothetical protein